MALWTAWMFVVVSLDPGLMAAPGQGGPCGGTIQVDSPSYVSSLGYPKEYAANSDCQWVLRAPETNQRLQLNFNPHFELEDRECRFDFVEIREGQDESGVLVGKFCGSIAPQPIVSDGDSLWIRFVSDYEGQGQGFSLRYEIFKQSINCHKNFTAPSGFISSPGFPKSHPHNLDCTYTITAPPHFLISLAFISFNMESDHGMPKGPACQYDHVEAWDGWPNEGLLIGRFCGSEIPGPIEAVTGTMTLKFYSDKAIAKDGFSATYSMIQQRRTEAFPCLTPLGMEYGGIPDERISASSTYYSNVWLPHQARLNYPVNGWTPSSDSTREWLQVDLGELLAVTGIATQGATSKESKRFYYVTSYKLDVSANGMDWRAVKEGRRAKVFVGNVDETNVVQNKLPNFTLARYVRLRPQSWENGISLRFELYGCHITDFPCSKPFGLATGEVKDWQMTASSEKGPGHAAALARLMDPHHGWTPKHEDAGEWLQVDLTKVVTVTGVTVQGTSNGKGNMSYVRKFLLGYSMDGDQWLFLQENNRRQKLLEGNSNGDLPVLRRFDPLVARFIRFYPQKWTSRGIGLRLEILGCAALATTAPPDVHPRVSNVTGSPPYHCDPLWQDCTQMIHGQNESINHGQDPVSPKASFIPAANPKSDQDQTITVPGLTSSRSAHGTSSGLNRASLMKPGPGPTGLPTSLNAMLLVGIVLSSLGLLSGAITMATLLVFCVWPRTGRVSKRASAKESASSDKATDSEIQTSPNTRHGWDDGHFVTMGIMAASQPAELRGPCDPNHYAAEIPRTLINNGQFEAKLWDDTQTVCLPSTVTVANGEHHVGDDAFPVRVGLRQV
uniref:neuropilin-1-like isoform X2 n=1 Tax=Myxine glutinosa TaxID=7769 RepID=UPI00358E2941